jgi:2',3'-cyclic-nucleotide 2'-phosphodiesterase (5'-nucleotidase family)
MGGLSRKSFQITTLTGKDASSVLLLDAGNLLFKRPTVAHPQELLTASGVMDIYRLMAYDAVAVGPNDLAAGMGFLKKSELKDFPWLSANLRDKNQTPIFPPARIIERGGIRIGIIGLTGQVAAGSLETSVVDWRTVLPEQLDRLSKDCQLVIVLSNLPVEDNAEVVQKYPQVHVLIAAGQQPGNVMPRVDNGTLVTQTMNQGKNLGVLNLDWVPGTSWAVNRDLEGQIASEKNAQKRQSSFTSVVIPLTKNLQEDPRIAAQIQHIKEQINTHNQAATTTDTRQNSAGSETFSGLVGFTRCQECHQTQARFWQTTRHAQSYTTLQRQQQNFNGDCLPCHITGNPPASGTSAPAPAEPLPTPSPGLQAVGCEVCHGPGPAHVDSPENIKPPRKVDEKICVSCHTKERDPHFDYRQKITKVSCPAD